LISIKRWFKDILLLLLGISAASFGLKGFLLSNHFIDGGATGIALLCANLFKMPLWFFMILINIPFVWLGYTVLGKRFAIKAAIAISFLSLVLATVNFPIVTNDKLLIAVFGGFFIGAGIGFSIRAGTVIDGTEILAIYVSRRLGVSIGDVIMAVNVLIFSAAAYLLGVEVALYSMITYLAASKTLDFILEGIDEYIGITIVASRSEEIKKMIIEVMGRGVTVYQGKTGYGKRGEIKEIEIIYTVLTRLELHKLNMEIEKIEPDAFVVMNAVRDTKGGLLKRKTHKEHQ
jgi:uncharacterized membrane-anchored protein YitT (DUF2179 family)